MNLVSLAKKANFQRDPKAFTARLPARLHQIRQEEALKAILRRESAYSKQKAISEASKAVQDSPYLSKDEKNKAITEIHQDGGGLGRILAAGIAAVGAPLALSALNTKVPGYVKAFSVPIAALGGATLFDLVGTPQSKAQFTKALPMAPDRIIDRWTR